MSVRRGAPCRVGRDYTTPRTASPSTARRVPELVARIHACFFVWTVQGRLRISGPTESLRDPVGSVPTAVTESRVHGAGRRVGVERLGARAIVEWRQPADPGIESLIIIEGSGSLRCPRSRRLTAHLVARLSGGGRETLDGYLSDISMMCALSTRTPNWTQLVLLIGSPWNTHV